MAGPDHAVRTIVGGSAGVYRRTPCPQCPWRLDAVGVFPAEAFKHSANVAHDRAMTVFACHDAGSKRPATCAGFLLRNSGHNLAVRLHQHDRLIDLAAVSDGSVALFDSYRAMAIANGVDPDDPALADCRADGYEDAA